MVDRYQLEAQVDAFTTGVQGQAGQLAQGLGNNVVAGVSTLINGFITIVSVLVLTFLMLIEGPDWLRRLWDSYHDPKLLERHKRLLDRMYRVVTGYVNGQVLVASIAASAAAVTLLILNTFFSVPVSAILPLAVIVFFTSMIPMIGATIGAAIVLTVLAFSDIGAALIFIIYFIVYQQIENNVIQPTVQSRSVELSALGIFTTAIVGIVSFGLIGGVLAIPVAGCIRVLVLDYLENRRAQRERHRTRVARAKA
jgi:predicted PurR-regulated permease PerM